MSAHSILSHSSDIYGNEILKIALSVACGCILGLEREIRGKSAGFRTLALICFGSTIFTLCSYLLGVEDNRDRIAANVITGVGFLGAGVIFRNNISVSGITTAASIWIAAAIGMFIGIGEYTLSAISLVLALFILYALDFIQFWLDFHFQHRDYRIVLQDRTIMTQVQMEIGIQKLKAINVKLQRSEEQIIMEAQVSGNGDQLTEFNNWLLDQPGVRSFNW